MKWMLSLLFMDELDWSWIINSFSIFGDDGEVIGCMFCIMLAWIQVLFYGFLAYKFFAKHHKRNGF